jgi:pyruvate/oxaloacetate carboxyltransferase
VLDHYRPMLNLRSLQTDPAILLHQVPGGMLSNLLSQLQEQDAAARLPEVLEEIPRVRADLGYPPLVTPTSQIVGIQAVVNVLVGKRYGQITREVRDYVRGLYGRAPGSIDPELAKRVLADDQPVVGRPADLLSPEFEAALTQVRALVPSADVAEALSFAIFPAVYRSFRASRDQGIDDAVLNAAAFGIVGALRTPSPPASSPVTLGAGTPANRWGTEGRLHQMASRRWVDANRARPRR